MSEVTIVTANADGQLGCAVPLTTALETAGVLPLSQTLTVSSAGVLKSVIKYADGTIMSSATVQLPTNYLTADQAVTGIKSADGMITLVNNRGQAVASTNVVVGLCAGA